MENTTQSQTNSSFIYSVFGQFSWNKPPWLRRTGQAGTTSAKKWYLVLCGLVLVLTGLYLWHRYKPKANEVIAVVEPPGITPLSDELKPMPLVIKFDRAAARLETMGKVVTQGVSLSPAISGTWVWEGDRQLRFNPKQDWPAGQNYQIDLDRSLVADHVKLKDYTLHFDTPAFAASLGQPEFYRDPKLHKIFRVISTIEFTHPVDPSSVKPKISFTMLENGKLKTYSFHVEFDAVGRRAFLQSEPLTLPEKQNFMRVTLAEGILPSKGQGAAKGADKQVLVPDLYSFLKVESLNAQIVRNANGDPEQVLVVKFTDELKPADVAKRLRAYLLPVNKGEKKEEDDQEEKRFGSPQEVNQNILKISKKLELTMLPTEKETSDLLFFKFRSVPKQQLYIKLEKGLVSVDGFVSAEDYDQLLSVPMFPREVQIQQQGSLLSLTGEKKLLLLTRGVPAVKIEIGRVMEGRLQYIATQTNGDFQKPRFFQQYQFNEEDITERFEDVKKFPDQDPAKAVYSTFDVGKYLNKGVSGKQGIFFVTVGAWDPEQKEYLKRTDVSESEDEESGTVDGTFKVQRLIIVTDLGVLVKENTDHSRDVFVQSLQQGIPVADAEVLVLGKNGLSVVSGKTSSDGHVKLPSMEDLKREKAPTVYLVRKGEDVSFLPYDRSDRRLNFSRFDVGGIESVNTESHLKAFVFSDRGIYRPGESIHVGVVVKQDDFNRDLTGVPVEVVLTDSKSKVVKKELIKLSQTGFEELNFSTQPSSPTGDYSVDVYLLKKDKQDAHLGSAYLRVQEFLPDRMKIQTRLTESIVKGWVFPDQIHAQVSLLQLFGSPAENRLVQGRMTLTRSYFHFSEFEDFQFTNPLENASRTLQVSEDLASQKTDLNGYAEFPLNLKRFSDASYRLTFFAEGFEAEGGRSVSGLSTMLVSPLTYMVGTKTDGDVGFIKPQSKRVVKVIAIDPQLTQIDVKALKLRFLKQRYVSTLVKQENGTFKYQSLLQELPIKEEELGVPKEGAQVNLLTENPGDYVMVIASYEQGQQVERARLPYTVAGDANLDASRSRNAELKVTLDKREYHPGETIEVNITAPYTGAGLITIERDKVYAFKWFQSTTTSSKQTIEVPKDFNNNGYVNVVFVRDLHSREIFMSPMSYGVVPFALNQEKHTIELTLKTKTKDENRARPGEDLTIEIQSSQKAKVVVFAVDEGILQVANYKTPNPLAYFFQKRALEVGTSQILDLILPELSIMQEVSQAGGGEAVEVALSKNLNPFRRNNEPPVVYWSSLIDVDEHTKTLHYIIPDSYAGTLRLMAIAVSPNALGRQEKSIQVQGDFVLSPNAPTFVAPLDEFEVSLAVFNHVEGSGKDAPIAVHLDSSGYFDVLDAQDRVLKISENHEGVARFKLKAKDHLGAADLVFTASFEKKHGKRSFGLSIRPPMPFQSIVQSGIIENATEEIRLKNSMYPEFQKLEVSMAKFPIALVPGLLRYLEGFPYGCSEQVVSKAFALLPFATDPAWRALLGVEQTSIAAHMQRAIDILRSRQDAEGAFGYWSAEDVERFSFVSVYATHFLLTAKMNHYEVPADLLRLALKNLEKIAVMDPLSLRDARIQAYSIYVLTESGMVTTNYLNHLLDFLEKTAPGQWRKDLTSVYLAATHKLLKKDRDALLLLDGFTMFGKKVDPNVENWFDDYYSPLVANSQYLLILLQHFPERSSRIQPSDLEALANPIIDSQYSTLSIAYAVQALFAYSKVQDTQATTLLSVLATNEGAGNKAEKLSFSHPLLAHSLVPIDTSKLVFSAPAEASHPYYQITRSGFSRILPAQEQKGAIEIYREYLEKDKPVSSVMLGQELTVKLTLRALSKTTLTHIAVVDLLPGGFEIVPDSLPKLESAPQGIEFAEGREDRMIWYGNFSETPTTLTYRIRATNAGTFVVPPAFCQSMYRHEVTAFGSPGTMEVKPSMK